MVVALALVHDDADGGHEEAEAQPRNGDHDPQQRANARLRAPRRRSTAA